MDETKEQPTELHELPEGDFDLDLADLDLDVPDLAEVDPTLPVVDEDLGGHAELGSDLDADFGSDLGDMSDLPTDDDLDLGAVDPAGGDENQSMDWDLPPGSEEVTLDPEDSIGDDSVGGLDPLAPEDDDDLQPVALSESELETILGSSEDDPLGAPIAEFDDTLEAPSISGDFEELATDDDLEVTDADLTVDDTSELDAGFSATGDDEDLSPITDTADLDFDLPEDSASPSFGDDDEDSEPVTLSEDELGSILDDVDPTATVVEGVAPPDEAPLPASPPGHEADLLEEDITLSDEELNQVLLDGDMDSPSDVAAPASLPSVLDDEDDEPITLTAEELGNIVADVETVEPAAPTEDDDGADLGAPGSSIFDSDEDEGPVALSEHELEAILEDVDDGHGAETATFGQDSAGPPEGEDHVIVLDDYEDETPDAGALGAAAAGGAAAAMAAREDSAVIDRAADASGLDKGDLKKMISYLDGLFEQLPDSTVEEFSRSEYYDLYKKIMSELGIGQ